ncbi:sortase-associated OmpA-like protein PdsO [Shewanella aestuarii]|uniref:Sortase-associated OmpA-like protein PdsO n=1 Tax=Shewanella aestuarii TaxID=1028752 RepID=A0A6G9QK19_9GAMM|nr:sortase-associated OmpA-like protein PdsO [Shewanella aestuarii]QIR14812.1 sortase-associated OmpA-like protein PdsO [Shewanella aestuarii]
MKKQVIAMAIISSVLVSNITVAAPSETNQKREHTEELVGMSSGIVLGAVIGGPVGAFIGALTGSFIGKSVGDESELKAQKVRLAEQQDILASREAQLAELQAQQQSLMAKQQEFNQIEYELAKLKAHQEQILTDLSLGMNVQFKTGSAQIEPLFKQQLDNVAYMMAAMPELNLDLMGYADRRGDDAFNQALSEQRLIEVTNYLAAQGIDKARLMGKAFGSSAPMHQEQSVENDFFDRRVTLKLINDSAQLTANQNH